MEKYSHDFTLVQQAEMLLYSSQRLHAEERTGDALERINEARQLLQQYLTRDNMVVDDDVADGWVKAQEAEAEIENLRRLAKHYQITQKSQNAVSLHLVKMHENRLRELDALKTENKALRSRIGEDAAPV